MRISDWSSDVCSSDLMIRERTMAGLAAARARGRKGGHKFALSKAQVRLAQAAMAQRDTSVSDLCKELGIDRKSVGEGKSVSVRVDLGGRRIITKKKNKRKPTKTYIPQNNKHLK